MLSNLAGFSISDSHIQRISLRIASEFDELDDIASTDWNIDNSDETNAPIEAASISIDGGRSQVRDEDSSAGVHNAGHTHLN